MGKITNNGGWKYSAQELVYSTDGGQTWHSYDPRVFRINDLIGLSSECSTIGTLE